MSESATTQESVPVDSSAMFPPIAGFWRRLGAWLADTFLLLLAGQILGWTFSSVFFQIGPYGRFVGVPILIGYFGLMNSRVGNGQTLGKRLLKIAVRNGDNKPISVARSLLRISIAAAPVILNGWALPIFEVRFLQWLLTIIVFGIGGAIFYTMVFNRWARQGLHDLACGTYVLHLPGKPVISLPATAAVHRAISGVWIGLIVTAATLGSFMGPRPISNANVASVFRLYDILRTDSRFYAVWINEPALHSGKAGPVHLLQITVWYKGVPPESQRTVILNEIAKVVLANVEGISQYDGLSITVASVYDLGIASGRLTRGDRQPISVWQQRTAVPQPVTAVQPAL